MNQFRKGEVYCAAPIRLENLCSAGTTAQAFPDIDNRPKSQDSIDALNALISNILEPIRLHYGHLTITHGFTSQALINKVPSGVAKRLDQHCAHELNSRGQRICSRGGASADIYVEKITAWELVDYIRSNLVFDRIYIYGKDSPVHVSYNDLQLTSQIVVMKPTSTGRRVPIVFRPLASMNDIKDSLNK